MYADSALHYLDMGYAPLPLPGGQKYPPPHGWTGTAGAWPSRADVQAWTEQVVPPSNVALRLPRGVLGVDVDAHSGKPGDESLWQWEESAGVTLDPEAPMSTSREGEVSGIRLFRVPEGLPLRSPGPGIDLITHGHRYVVAPPSVVEGRTYRWVRPLVPAERLPPLPQAMLALIVGTERTGATAPGRDLTRGDALGWRPMRDAYLDAWRRGESRHDSMVTALGWAFREANAGLVPWSAAYDALREAWQNSAVSDSERRTSPGEWRDMVAWVQDNALKGSLAPQARIRSEWTASTPQAAVGAVEGRTEASAAPEAGRWGTLATVEEIQALADAVPEGGVEVPGGGRLLVPGTTTLLVGTDGSGKTSLGLRLALAATAGAVLLVAKDAGPMVLARRLAELPVEDRSRVRVSRPAVPSLVDDTFAPLVAGGWGAVVLDAMTGLLSLDGVDEWKGADVRGWWDRVAAAFAQRGAAVVMLDHPRKAQGGKSEEAAGGSAQKRAGADYGLTLYRRAEGHGRLVVTKDNYTSWQPGAGIDVAWKRSLGGTVTTAFSLAPEDEEEADPRTVAVMHAVVQAVKAEWGDGTWTKAGWERVSVDMRAGRTLRAAALQEALQRGVAEEVGGHGVYRLLV